jgi:Predicted phosphohydrolases
MPSLLAVSDLHVANPANREIVAALRPGSPDDWLLVAGDVGELTTDIEWALRTLKDNFSTVAWTPGNHELWTLAQDPVQLRGEARYRYLVNLCREIGVVTPEDPYLIWDGLSAPVVVAPLFLLYDHTFRPDGAATTEEALAKAYESGVVCADEVLLGSDPYPTREAWCRARLDETERRLLELGPAVSSVLVNHFPLVRDPTRALRYPEFAQWCGTAATADWHKRFGAIAVVYGHLHIPRTTSYDGVRFEEVSLGYPREWRRRKGAPGCLRRILPFDSAIPPVAR